MDDVCSLNLDCRTKLTKKVDKSVINVFHIWVIFPRTGIQPSECHFFGSLSCVRTPTNFVPNIFLKVLDQNSGLLNPKILTKSFENAPKMHVLDLYFQNFLRKVIFMQSLGLYYSRTNTSKCEKNYSLKISCCLSKLANI